MAGIDNLNPEQREAALHKDGPLLILAGAGSGKTETMTQRIVHLIKNENVRPENILAVTFTNKAAKMMKERVAKNLGDANAWVRIMTFHSFCLWVLRYHGEELGYKKNFAVYDPTDQKAVVKRLVREMDLDDSIYKPARVLHDISKFKEAARSVVDVDEAATLSGKLFEENIATLYRKYQAKLRSNNAMDFDDLILNAVRLFEANERILATYQRMFEYIMVDEYQDTNYLQFRLVQLLADKHQNLCVVGDDDQCIYQWRGADITNILNFEKNFKNTKVIKLEQNYRSTEYILKGANSVIANNQERKKKKLWTDRGAGEKIAYRVVRDQKEEAHFVASEIMKLLSEGQRFSDIAILYRTNAQSRTFEDEFFGLKIPYQMLGSLRYYERKEIKDMISYMSLVQNPDDDVALIRVINEPKRGIGPKGLAGIISKAAEKEISIMQLLTQEDGTSDLSSTSKAAVAEFVAMMTSLSAEYENYKISEIYNEILERTRYIQILEAKNRTEDDARIENILGFTDAIIEFEKENPSATLPDFLENLALMSDVDSHKDGEDAVTFMTIHSAKGLEFPVVFLVGMEENLFPSPNSQKAVNGIEEERRLCYVGMTRAMEKLYLVRAKDRMLYGRYDRTLESRFLGEIDKAVLDGDVLPGADVTGFFHAPMGGGDGYESSRRISSRAGAAAGRGGLLGKSGGMSFAKGDKVSHPKFGEGLVIEVNGSIVTVIFDSVGTKKLATEIAPLEKL
ncbi:MAG: UvrD-helicase domain-containing protein [Clostridiales Family XIII bacterium]|nr:UvrD-helicase domain-containing protein [Clostridiales Family XIII bacterium]